MLNAPARWRCCAQTLIVEKHTDSHIYTHTPNTFRHCFCIFQENAEDRAHPLCQDRFPDSGFWEHFLAVSWGLSDAHEASEWHVRYSCNVIQNDWTCAYCKTENNINSNKNNRREKNYKTIETRITDEMTRVERAFAYSILYNTDRGDSTIADGLFVAMCGEFWVTVASQNVSKYSTNGRNMSTYAGAVDTRMNSNASLMRSEGRSASANSDDTTPLISINTG